jgi:hypothetical protein
MSNDLVTNVRRRARNRGTVRLSDFAAERPARPFLVCYAAGPLAAGFFVTLRGCRRRPAGAGGFKVMND